MPETAKDVKRARGIVKEYASSVVKGLIARSRGIRNVENPTTKGRLRELFVSGLLKPFMPKYLAIGSGIIVNASGRPQSLETDIVIYDSRLMPPFLSEGTVGIYPIQSVMGTIEVKSILTSDDIKSAENGAKRLLEISEDPKDPLVKVMAHVMRPICVIFAYEFKDPQPLLDANGGKAFLGENAISLSGICALDRFSWMNMQNKGWIFQPGNAYNEETKRFISILLDNIRYRARERFEYLSQCYRDWLGEYIRDQDGSVADPDYILKGGVPDVG